MKRGEAISAGGPGVHREPGAAAALARVAVGPVAWVAQEYLGYALASALCGTGARHPVAWVGGVAVISAIAIVATALAGLGAWRRWRQVRGDGHAGAHGLLDIGEGRDRFLAVCGWMVALGFVVAIVFTAAALLLAPACAAP